MGIVIVGARVVNRYEVDVTYKEFLEIDADIRHHILTTEDHKVSPGESIYIYYKDKNFCTYKIVDVKTVEIVRRYPFMVVVLGW